MEMAISQMNREKTEIQAKNSIEDCPIATLPLDVRILIFSMLNPKALADAALSCKHFYATSKDPRLWQLSFQRHFSKIKWFDPMTYQISLEQQFKILFLYLRSQEKPFIVMEVKIRARVLELQGPNGCDGEIEGACRQLEALRKRHAKEPKKEFAYQLDELLQKYNNLRSLLKKLAGLNFNGSAESIEPGSQLWNASFFRRIHSYEFDGQKTFEKLINDALQNKKKNKPAWTQRMICSIRKKVKKAN